MTVAPMWGFCIIMGLVLIEGVAEGTFTDGEYGASGDGIEGEEHVMAGL